MKILVNEEKKEFKPITITLVFENKDDVEDWEEVIKVPELHIVKWHEIPQNIVMNRAINRISKILKFGHE